ncbi:MAG: carboxyl transferase domain-containing protein [Oligoflexus sp.]
MERKILGRKIRIGIVNRGEAAVRFIRAAKEFNILYQTSFETVAFYIDSEADALFVKEADHAYSLSHFSDHDQLTSTPYINTQFMLRCLQETDCQGVWVGWGFLAEDSQFAAALEEAGLILIGPTAIAMDLLGDKIKAKALANESDVPTLPWSGCMLRDLAHAEEVAMSIGYPVILKSANGGGGRGIRKVYQPSEMAQQFKSVSEEIFRFFGNRVIFMEALVQRGRHLEVQAVADYHGNVQTFGVRDCSVQRNNQKIIEETPPPQMNTAETVSIEACSARLLQAAKYHGAGTVEYLYDVDRKQAYFMEVNTRLQVEHPITEELFQIDLVHLQLKVALGEKLDQARPEPRGHVIEVRLNAEDPDNKFAPTPGRIKRYLPPTLPGLRIDSGFEWGSRIPRDFDSMVAKVIARSPSREGAIARLTRALQELQIEIDGGTTNQGFLLELFHTPEVQEGGVQTDFVERFLLERRGRQIKNNWDIAIIAAAIYQYEQRYRDEFENFTEKVRRFSSPRRIPDLTQEIQIQWDGHKYSFQVRSVGHNMFHIEVDDQVICVEYVNWGHEIIFKASDRKYKLQIVPRAGSLQVEVEGMPYVLPIDASGMIAAPSPSVVLTIDVTAGQTVKKGQLLLTLEAMKMEMTVSAPEDGIVTEVLVKAGEQVAAGQMLIDMETESEAGENEEESVKEASQRLDFLTINSSKDEGSRAAAKRQFEQLARDYYAAFIGYDYQKPVVQNLQRLESFVEKHPEFRSECTSLVLESLQAFTRIQRLFLSDHFEDQNEGRETDVYEYLMHYILRREDREKGLPEKFLQRLHNAIELYPWADVKRHEDTTRALFHMYVVNAHNRDIVELARLSLLYLQQLYPHVPEVMPSPQVTDLLNDLISVSRNNGILIDAAIYARYELVDRIFQNQVQQERQQQVADLLNSVLELGDESPQLMENVIDSGHQIVSYLMSLYEAGSARSKLILEIIAKRFNRDRSFVEGSLLEYQGVELYHLSSRKHGESFTCIVTILKEEEFLKPLDWLRDFLSQNQNDHLEVMILVKTTSESSEITTINHLSKYPLPVHLCSLGLYQRDDYYYRSFFYDEKEHWTEDSRRRYLSPLRYRELRLERLQNFDLELLYHSRYVHVMKLEAKENAKDQRLFAFVEVPETQIDLNESQVIQRISAFEYGILEAVKVIREQQARHKRSYLWNRIVVHIGHTHPLKLEQIGQYPKNISGLVEGLGLEKIVIYTKIAGRQRKAIEAEVLVEKFSTKYSVRGRIPSRETLKPLDPYSSKVVRSLRINCPYPYEVISMLTNPSSEDFPSGEFVEYDIQFDSSGQQHTISVEGRPPGSNLSNVVFGKIRNRDLNGYNYERVLLLGDPSKDLGSLAEDECRRVIAAIDMAEADVCPVEWIPISSGAAIDMKTGTENLDWTARVLRRIIEFTQKGGEINIIVSGINVGAQSYWNAEATMLMHTRGILIMTEAGSMVLTGKKALDFSGSVSADDNIGIGGVERIMGPNGQAQFRVKDLAEAYRLLFRHYRMTYRSESLPYGSVRASEDPIDRNVCEYAYRDFLNQGFQKIGDILGTQNAERKKPFDMRQIMHAVRDQDSQWLERWQIVRDAETAIVWETQVCGYSVGMIGIESRPLKRYGDIPNDGPDSWTGGTLYPQSSKKVARAINAFSAQMPVVVLANLSGFDGSPESLRKLQLEYGAEIGRAVVNFKGPLIFVVVSRYHGGAYVVFSKTLNPDMRIVALENTFASVIGGAPAAAVVFPREVMKNTFADPQIIEAQRQLKEGIISKADFDEVFQTVHLDQQAKMAQKFEKIHTVERAQQIGSVDDIISASQLRPYLHQQLREGIAKFQKPKVH